MQPGRRAAAVAPFHVMRVLEEARALEEQGCDLIHLEVGEPDFLTPGAVVTAAGEALASRPLGYTPAAGLPALRQAIAGYYGWRYGLDIDPARVLVTPGGSGALQLALMAILDAGDRVLLTDPGYPCNRHLVSLAGGVPDALPVWPEQDYQPTLAALEQAWTPRTRALMLATPANPTGTTLTPARLGALHDLVASQAGALIVDEIYQGLLYEGEDHSALALNSEHVFVANSFSKYFGMTGWRLGWLVAPQAFTEVLVRLAQNLYLAPPTLAQYAAGVALAPALRPELDRRRDRLRARRDLLIPALTSLGFELPAWPRGAFYLYLRAPADQPTAAALAARLLQQGGVAVTPGCDFGTNETSTMLRIAYTQSRKRLQVAIDRIATVLRDR